jgi:glucokinase
MYVIGGGVSAAWDLFEPAMLKELRKRSIVYTATAPDGASSTASGSSRHTIVTRALLGSDAGLVGAARLPMVEAERRHHSSSRTK